MKYLISSSQKLHEFVVYEIPLFVVNEMRFRKVNLFIVIELESGKTKVKIQEYHNSLTMTFYYTFLALNVLIQKSGIMTWVMIKEN